VTTTRATSHDKIHVYALRLKEIYVTSCFRHTVKMFEKHWQLPIPTRTSQPATQHTEINSSQETLTKSKRKQLNPEIIKEIRKTYDDSSERPQIGWVRINWDHLALGSAEII
jgi:hypothetical protein